MHLITLAHLGEAQSIIERFKLERISPSFYKGENLHCLITGEGPFEAGISTAKLLGMHCYSKVLNLGIAGSLDAKLAVKSCHQVRTLYLVIEGRPQFKTFSTGAEGIDLITSFERILTADKAQHLKGVGKLVDREAWGVAMAAKTSQVPFECYKLVSDMAGSLDACELAREKAAEFSELLWLKLKELLAVEKSTEAENLLGPEFYFTFTAEKKFTGLLKKLSLRENQSSGQVLKELGLTELAALKITPKERALKLIEQMELALDPFKGRLQQLLSEWKAPFAKAQIDIQTDPCWENERVKISLDVSKQDELEEKLRILQALDLSAYHQIREGKL